MARALPKRVRFFLQIFKEWFPAKPVSGLVSVLHGRIFLQAFGTKVKAGEPAADDDEAWETWVHVCLLYRSPRVRPTLHCMEEDTDSEHIPEEGVVHLKA